VHTESIIALSTALFAAVVAVVVPVWTFNRTLELERVKWVRDQCANLYIDILAEAYAEKQWFLDLMTRREITLIEARNGGEHRGPSRANFPPSPDLRLDPVERARLGARGAVFASHKVTVAFNTFTVALGRPSLIPPQTELEAQAAKLKADELFDALSTAIRTELGGGAELALSEPTADGTRS
jgi:hypothetical protein